MLPARQVEDGPVPPSSSRTCLALPFAGVHVAGLQRSWSASSQRSRQRLRPVVQLSYGQVCLTHIRSSTSGTRIERGELRTDRSARVHTGSHGSTRCDDVAVWPTPIGSRGPRHRRLSPRCGQYRHCAGPLARSRDPRTTSRTWIWPRCTGNLVKPVMLRDAGAGPFRRRAYRRWRRSGRCGTFARESLERLSR